MLTFKEFELLAHLVENSSRTVGRGAAEGPMEFGR